MQGFQTISRSTSYGPSLFLDGLVQFGVGLNHVQFAHNISNCGRCLRINNASMFIHMNDELDSWNKTQVPLFPYIAMVFDECRDPVCQDGYLDIDIYNERQPVEHGNPSSIEWEFIDCPRSDNVEFLFCFSNTCKYNDTDNRTIGQVLDSANPYHWAVFIRNLPTPVWDVCIEPQDKHLENREGWVWDHGMFHFYEPFSITLNKQKNLSYPFDFKSIKTQKTTTSYNGGLLLHHIQKK